jgi:hypothetical protein
MDAFGTANRSFFDGLASQLTGLGIQESKLNFALACVRAVKPRDELEAMLAAQMVAVHLTTMRAGAQSLKVKYIQQQDSASTMLNKGARTFAVHMEALKKHRSNGEQIVKVQHVNVGNGGQAVITDTMQAGGGGLPTILQAVFCPFYQGHVYLHNLYIDYLQTTNVP